MKKNSFKELEEKKLKESPDPSASIKSGIDRELNLFRFVGDMIELYLSKLIGAFASLGEFRKEDEDSVNSNDL